MNTSGLSLSLLVVFGLACITSGNPISSFFSKSQDEKTDSDDKSTPTTAKAGNSETTTTGSPSSSCGGLKGFLHICDKHEPSEPPKSVKTRRNAPEENSSSNSSSSSSSSSSSEEDADGNANEKTPVTEVTIDDPTEAMIVKREVEDTEEPPAVGQPLIPPEVPVDAVLKKRQIDDLSESESTESEEEDKRRKRDCRDRDGDYEKDCRKKRASSP